MMQSRENQTDLLLPSFEKAVAAGNVARQAVAIGNAPDCSDYPRSDLTREEIFGVTPNYAGEQSQRVFASAATSASDQRTITPSQTSTYTVPPTQALLAQIYDQNLGIDAVIRLQSERLRLVMREKARRRQRNVLISILERRVAKRMREKETELVNANRKKAELEEKVREIISVNQMLSNIDKNNEATIYRLRTSIEQVLLQNTAAAAAGVPLREGNGDSDGDDDAKSCCFEEEVAPSAPAGIRSVPMRMNENLWSRLACWICHEKEVCVLIIPCRHLCLCKDCEMTVGNCPVCHIPKNSCFHIFMS